MYKDVLARIEQENAEKNYWIVGPKVGHMLWWLVRVWAPESVLEIGTSVGYSAIWIASALKENGGGRLWTVESHAERFEKAKANIAASGLGEQIVQLKGHAPEIFDEERSLPAELEFAFFDATKGEHGQYFDAVFPRLKAGALLVVDNVQSHREEMGDFFAKIADNDQLEEVELDIGTGLLLVRKI